MPRVVRAAQGMQVIFRTDASSAIGHGHVMRCLTLASALRERDAAASFVCREHPGHLCDAIAQQGFAVHRLPASAQTADSWQEDAQQTLAVLDAHAAVEHWLVVDHYALDQRWERAVLGPTRRIMAVDDLADRPHDCEILLDQNYFPDAELRYEGLLPVYCTRYVGPQYVLLRDEFRQAKPRASTAHPPRLLIFFGGGDPTGQSEVALDAALAFDPTLAMDVIVGRNNPRAEAMQARCRDLPQVRVFRHVDNISELMARASLCLGAGGIATFERLYMELPSIVVATADNQHRPLQALADLGCIDYLGAAARVRKADWLAALQRWRSSGLQQTPLAVGTHVDRVPAAMSVSLVPFAERHVESTFQLIQDADLRVAFGMAGQPEWVAHVDYWQRKLAAGIERVFAIELAGEHVGNCGIKPMPGSHDREGWIYLGRSPGKRGGTGELAFRRLLHVAFVELQLARLYLHVKRDNAAALGLYRKIGFRPAAEPVDVSVWGERAAAMCKLVIAR